MVLIIYHGIAFVIGFVLDLLIGDPQSAPHPIRLIGKFIAFLEKRWNSEDKQVALRGGRIMVFTVSASVILITAAILVLAYFADPKIGIAVEAILTYYVLAARSLYDESMKVYRCLESGNVEAARSAVSMIVGRDTQALDETGITKAAVETVAENASDGVIAPMIFTAAAGPALGMFYKAVNTMDSMVGYKNDRYLYFGRAAAKLDDALNYIPSRISAYLMMLACVFCGRDFSVKGAFEIHKRDSRKHASPNSAQTESTCAGALGIQLAGDASYFGVVHKKPYIGDAKRPVEYADIRRANRLMLTAAVICEIICLLIIFVIGM